MKVTHYSKTKPLKQFSLFPSSHFFIYSHFKMLKSHYKYNFYLVFLTYHYEILLWIVWFSDKIPSPRLTNDIRPPAAGNISCSQLCPSVGLVLGLGQGYAPSLGEPMANDWLMHKYRDPLVSNWENSEEPCKLQRSL